MGKARVKMEKYVDMQIEQLKESIKTTLDAHDRADEKSRNAFSIWLSGFAVFISLVTLGVLLWLHH